MKGIKLWGVCRGGVLEKKIQSAVLKKQSSRGKDPVISKLKGYLIRVAAVLSAKFIQGRSSNIMLRRPFGSVC